MGMTMQDMVKTLASLPEEQRETMMEERLKMFAEMGDEERLQAMQGMIRAVVSLPEGQRKKLIRTRTRLLLDFPEEVRSRLMTTHMGALQGLSEQERMAEMQTVQSVIKELPGKQRSMMQKMMEKMMPGGGAPREPAAKAPTMSMQDMVKALAAMPDDQRETMMRERLTMFAEMGEAERRQGMKGMIRAVIALPQADRQRLIRTRTKLLMGFAEETRQKLMSTHMAALRELPESERMTEMQTVQAVIADLPDPQRSMMQAMMEKMMPGMPAGAGAPRARADARGPALRTVAPSVSSDRLAGWGATVMWLTALAGVWVLIAPFILGFSGTAGAGTGNHVVFGIGIAALAGLVALSRQWVGWTAALTWIVVLAGIWLIISPWVLGYSGSGAATGNAVLFGAVVTVLSGIVALARPRE